LLISISFGINATWVHPRLFFISWHLVDPAKVVLDCLHYTIIIMMWSTNQISKMILYVGILCRVSWIHVAIDTSWCHMEVLISQQGVGITYCTDTLRVVESWLRRVGYGH
jgi:hypothetical protein